MTGTKDKLLGSIFGAAFGDAMGALTETRSAERIKEDFGGFVETLFTPPADCFAHDLPAGAITDDFSLAYFTGLELARCGGNVDNEVAERAVLKWAEYPEFLRFAGPTTLAAVKKLQGIEVPYKNHYIACDNTKGTNGSGMKIFCAGLINPGNPDKAIEDAATLCMPTHPNNVSISAAAAISAATAKAMEDGAELKDVLEAGIYGAERGFAIGSAMGHRMAAPSVVKRIKLAIEIAGQGMGWEETMLELRDIIGAGLMAAEAIPCVFGILAANPKDAFGAVKMGVNIGDDTDTVATMAGAVAGALYGMSNLPQEYMRLIDETNHIDIENLASEIERAYYS
ncbi:ADP-ribosylglycohydrolase family protein [Clostridium sp. AM58-1XD]|uniref:ADP-ribosylglycohydrolase family protein n=1 Tax=Clostridium sp. AM58-1XD TaxID=2292307 RepID=UPI000E4C95F9|nr:ADP-ribosylglycohydrolase family protein [Clostridium sp. AM58-1XD]RGZ00365.1 hypothetical protein DXA13_04735 [Clostridium sp. AM58-1XD]